MEISFKSLAVIIDEKALGTIEETHRHFVPVIMAKNTKQFSWTDEAVKLLLLASNEYKIRNKGREY